MKTSFISIQTTTNSKEIAEKIMESLLLHQLAACIQINPIESFYMWEGKMKKAEEFRISIKTKQVLYKEVEAFILEYHNYEIPELIQLSINDGYEEYLDWMGKVTK